MSGQGVLCGVGSGACQSLNLADVGTGAGAGARDGAWCDMKVSVRYEMREMK